MSNDLSQYMDMFAAESREHLQALNQSLLKFEQDTEDIDIVNEIFRSAHTLKGMSATMGFNDVAELTHNMENLLTPVRQSEMKASDETIELLFNCLDALESMIDAHIEQVEHDVDISGLVSQMAAMAQGVAGTAKQLAASGSEPAVEQSQGGYPAPIGEDLLQQISTSVNNGMPAMHVHVNISEACEMLNVRGYMAIASLKEQGSILHCVPDEEVIVNGEGARSFDLLLLTDSQPEGLTEMLDSISEISSSSCVPFGSTVRHPGMTDMAEIFGLSPNEMDLIRHGLEDGLRAIYVTVTLEEECVLKSARIFMVHRALEESGEIVFVNPTVEEIEADNFGSTVHFMAITDQSEENINEGLSKVSELASHSVLVIDTEEKKQAEPEPQAMATAGQAAAASAAGSKASTPQQAQAQQQARGNEKVRHAQTIRVDTERLDMLLNLVGELVIGKTRLHQLAQDTRNREMSDSIEHFGQVVFDLQSVVMQTRMVPIETVFNRFPRMIRDLAKSRDKKISLEMSGAETEMDRTVIDEIGDPLVHLIRNSVDHGLESPAEREAAGKDPEGNLHLAAFHEGSNVFIQIRDDGRGIDPDIIRKKAVEKGIISQDAAAKLSNQEAIELIFEPGFSTAEQITDISGRGVGMDAVRSKIDYLNGEVNMTSEKGKGTVVTIKLPLTLAIVQAQLVDIAREVFAIPLAYIEETLKVRSEDIKRANQKDVIMLRGDILPLVYMRELLGSPPSDERADSMFVIVVASGKQRVGLVADRPLAQMEIVIKSLGRFLQEAPYMAGGTILGDGRVALILDVAQLAA
ncbi:chemotaxis protein CheW [bacterium]|nr:chemotaxis protein CheW [bacterium]